MNFLLLTVALYQLSVAQAQIEEPPNPGVYVRGVDGWESAEPIRAVDGTERLTRTVLHGQPPQDVWLFRNPHASIKILGKSVQLFVRDLPNFGERDVLIVKLDVKRDHRELRTTSGGNLSTFKSGLSRKNAPKFETRKITDHTYSIILREPLPPGEYMITIAPGMRGYDFAVQ
jgi:hypothetical protein